MKSSALILNFIFLFCFYFTCHGEVRFNPQSNSFELMNDELDTAENQRVYLFIPQAPYHHLSCIITMPTRIVKNEDFTIFYTIKSSGDTVLACWDNLIPSSDLLQYKSHTVIRNGTEDASLTDTLIKQRTWKLSSMLEKETIYTLAITLKALHEGSCEYTTLLATHPLDSFGPIHVRIHDK